MHPPVLKDLAIPWLGELRSGSAPIGPDAEARLLRVLRPTPSAGRGRPRAAVALNLAIFTGLALHGILSNGSLTAAGRPGGLSTGDSRGSAMRFSTLLASGIVGASAIAPLASAQEAVQWKVSDGGNGHWYQLRLSNPGLGWTAAQNAADAAGGYLATLTSAPENSFVFELANVTSAYGGSPVVGPWIGGRRTRDQWSWVNGDEWIFVNWLPPNPDGPGTWGEDRTCLTSSAGQWNDFNESGVQPGLAMRSYVVEWSADCNDDGIVDYGQCRDGSLTDFNGNNIPDCCEANAPCSDPVQWRVEDGGNGHWYEVVIVSGGVTWDAAKQQAELRGGRLACLETPQEGSFVLARFSREAVPSAWVVQMQPYSPMFGPWLGASQTAGSVEPAGGWRWLTGGLFDPTMPPYCCNNVCEGSSEDRLHLYSVDGTAVTAWNDLPNIVTCGNQPISYLLEYEADCTNDGLVDYGQIRAGELEDSNANNIPDCCESGAPCTPNLLVNGGFEIGATQLDCTWVIHSANSAFVPGWSVVSASVDRQRLSAACPIGTESWTSFGGEFTIDLDGWSAGGAIAQTVATRSGRAYRVTFQLTGNCGALGDKPMRVEIGSGSWGFVHTCQPTNPQPWNEKSVEFVASGPATTIVLRSLMTDGRNGPVVDAVRLEEIVQECPADVDASGAVNAIDLAIILSNWGTDGGKYPGADVDRNGTVDALDLAEVLNGWGPCS